MECDQQLYSHALLRGIAVSPALSEVAHFTPILSESISLISLILEAKKGPMSFAFTDTTLLFVYYVFVNVRLSFVYHYVGLFVFHGIQVPTAHVHYVHEH